MKKFLSNASGILPKGNLFIAVALITVSLIQNNTAEAQNRWSLQVRPAANFPTKDLGDAKLKTGFGGDGTVAYRFMPHLGAYAGWGWSRFSSDNSFAGAKMDFEETGYTLGLQFIHPIAKSKISYMVSGGGIYNHIETENPKGDIVSDSRHGLGWQGEAGLSIPVGQRFHFIPGIRYRSLSRDFTIENTTTAIDLNYLSAGVSFTWSF